MEECRHCGDSFSDEETLLRHVADEHPGEMGEIERRRLRQAKAGGWSPHPGVVAGVVASGLVVAVFVYFVLFADVTEVVEPTDRGVVDEYGTISIEVDGEPLDLTRTDYLEVDGYWYLDPDTVDEADEGYVWEKHGRDVTLEYALLTLGVDVADDTSNATYTDVTAEASDPREASYDRTEGDTVEVTVNGEDVNPREHRLQGADSLEDADDGDSVRVVLEAAE